MSRIDWRGLMRAGLHDLRLSPAEFWAMTPVELSVMLGVVDAAPPLSRSRLEELIQAFPDRDGEDRDAGH